MSVSHLECPFKNKPYVKEKDQKIYAKPSVKLTDFTSRLKATDTYVDIHLDTNFAEI
jgi:hypothetical protein